MNDYLEKGNFPCKLLCKNITHRIILTDLDLKITYTNGSFLGVDTESLIGEEYLQYTIDPGSKSEILNFMESKDVKPVQYKNEENKVIILDTKILGFPDHDDKGSRKGYMIIVYDIKYDTNYKMRFMSNISHEIRTPLNSLLGVTQLLENTDLNEKQLQYLNLIQESGSSLLSIFNNILDLSLLESQRVIPNLTSVNIQKCMEESIDFLMSRTIEKKIVINHNLTSNTSINKQKIPENIITDYGRLQQILINVIGNAIKFTTEGGEINIEISASKPTELYNKSIVKYNNLVDNLIEQNIANESTSSNESNTNSKSHPENQPQDSRRYSNTTSSEGELNKSRSGFTGSGSISLSSSTDLNFKDNVNLLGDFYVVNFRIKDTGIGIENKNYSNIFKAFTQFDKSNSNQLKGTGLGLALSKKLSNLLFGDIRLEGSERGKGSIFSFEIMGRELNKKSSSLNKNRQGLENLSALIIDADQMNRVIISNQILQLKMTPVGCSSFDEAFIYLDNYFKVDVILIHIKTGNKAFNKNIKNVVEKIKQYYEVYIPIIGIFNQPPHPNDQVELYKYLNQHITKPITPTKMIDNLLKVLDQSKISNTNSNPYPNLNPNSELLSQSQYLKKIKVLLLINDDNTKSISNLVSRKSPSKVLHEMLQRLGYKKIEKTSTQENAFQIIKQSSSSVLTPSYDLVIMNNPEENIEMAKKVKKDKKIKKKPKMLLLLNNEEIPKYQKYKTKEIVHNFISIPIKMTQLKSTLDKLKY